MIFAPNFFEGLRADSQANPKLFYQNYNIERVRAIVDSFDREMNLLPFQKNIRQRINQAIRPQVDHLATPADRVIRSFCFIHTIRILRVLQPTVDPTSQPKPGAIAHLPSSEYVSQWLSQANFDLPNNMTALEAILESLPAHLQLYRNLYSYLVGVYSVSTDKAQP